MAVRIVAARAGGLALHEASRALERFDDEGRLTEAPVFVEALSRKLAKGNALGAHKEFAGSRIIDFAAGTGYAQRGLHVALRANSDKIAIVGLCEIYRWVNRLFAVTLAIFDRADMAPGWTVAHLAANARLAKFATNGRRKATLLVAQLASI